MLTDQSGIRDKIRFLRKVTEIKYLGDGNCTWQVTTLDAITGGSTKIVTSHHVVNAGGHRH